MQEALAARRRDGFQPLAMMAGYAKLGEVPREGDFRDHKQSMKHYGMKACEVDLAMDADACERVEMISELYARVLEVVRAHSAGMLRDGYAWVLLELAHGRSCACVCGCHLDPAAFIPPQQAAWDNVRIDGAHPGPSNVTARLNANGTRVTPVGHDKTCQYLVRKGVVVNRGSTSQSGGPDGRPLVGTLPGVPVGTVLQTRQMLHLVGAHGPRSGRKTLAGIFSMTAHKGRIRDDGERGGQAALAQSTVADILGNPELALSICDAWAYKVSGDSRPDFVPASALQSRFLPAPPVV